MTVKELKGILTDKPDNLRIFFSQTNDEYTYSLVETAEVKKVNFSIELENGEIETAQEDCLVITDE